MSSARSCEICRNVPAVAYCDCSQPFAYFCSGCTKTHFNLPRPHNYIPLSVSISSRTSRSSSRKEGLNDDCILCHNAEAEIICCCQRALIMLCKPCYPRHCEKSVGDTHVVIPYSAKVYINKPGYLQNLISRKRRLDQRKTEILGTIQRITTCMDELRRKSDSLLERIASYCAENIATLSQAKESIESKLRTAVSEAEDFIYDPDYEPRDSLAQMLLAADDRVTEEPLFSYQLSFHAEAVDSALHLEYHLMPLPDEESPAVDSVLMVPWLNSTSLKLYNTEKQTWEVPITYQRTFVDQNSSVAMLPNKRIMVSGSTKARRKVLKIDIESKTARLINPFSVKRFGHGFIYWRDFVYAFGGYQLRSCEKIASEEEDALWESLPEMSCPHQFSTPSAFGNYIYICGGDGTNVVELFDTATVRFSVIRHITLPEKTNTFSVVDKKKLIIFQKDLVITWQLGSIDTSTIIQRKLIDPKYTYSNVSGLLAKHFVFSALYYKKLLVCVDLASLNSVKITL